MRFFSSCSPDLRWRSNPNAEFRPRDLFPTMMTLQTVQPDKAAIRQVVGKRVRLEHAAWLIEEASRDRRLLPSYILLRQHSSTLRFSDAVELAQRELFRYLSSTPPSRLSSREKRALVLLQWLNDSPERWYSFFCTPGRATRAGGGEGEGRWERWLEEPRRAEEGVLKGRLEEWEGRG
ncbi:hypothetical protein JCM8547_008090 [Rhodosporidiobolus lusitaniae]